MSGFNSLGYMKIMKKLFYAFAVFFTIAGSMQTAIGQDDDCNKTKIAVSVKIVPKAENYDHLAGEFGTRPNSEWNGFVAKMIVEVLSEYEPDITFFSLREGGRDYHYHFDAHMSLNTVGEGSDEHTVYWIASSLTANSNCIPNRNWVLDAYDGKDSQLKQTIKNLVSQFRPMDRNIIQYEKNHPSPPRDPELNIQIEKDFISPLGKESRITEVYAKVYDCRGLLVCDTGTGGQPVYYQDKIDRLDLKIGRNEGGYHIGNFMVIITNKECENTGKYKLEKGVDPERKSIRFKTCRLGSGPIIEEEKELIIRGLEVEVKPDRKEIHPDEHTDIVIIFSETEPDGIKHPVEGKEIQVELTGLEDGTIKAKDGYTTNRDGKVVLDYKAGDLDEKITVRAWFEPPDYPDKAEGKASVTVKPDDHDVSLTLRASFQWKDDSNNHFVEGMATMTIQGSMKFDQRYQIPMVKRYVPENLIVGWSFKETLRDFTGDPDCPELVQELSGSGSTAIPDPALKEVGFLEVRKFGEVLKEEGLKGFLPPEAKEQLADQFMLVLPAAKQQLRGKARKSSTCGENTCPCKEYRDIDKEVGVGSIAIRGKMEPDGSVRGGHYWVAQGSSMRTLGFQVNEIGKKVDFEPPVLKKLEGKLINISVSWDIQIKK